MPRSSRRPGNLPAETTSFIGRRRELIEVKRSIGLTRLVSLVGPGGVGKTRLAVRAASELARGYRDGAWMVELAEIRDGELMPNAVLAALDLHDQTSTEPAALLRTYLRDKEMLIVIDNCEHLLSACALFIHDVLGSAQELKVIATSREPLTVSGEYVLPVLPLELPAAGAIVAVSHMRQNEAVALFVERAEAASGGFELNAGNQVAVVEICRRLDGLPLAIELAAARSRVLSVKEIRSRLSDRFGLLTGGSRAALPRHQTLRLAIDWSYELLTDTESALLRQLAVFAGEFDLAAAEAVSGHDQLESISSLVDKSLVIRAGNDDSSRYRLHETMREYALLKLREAGEEEATAERQARYYLTTCIGSIDRALRDLVRWLQWMDAEVDNVRALLSRWLEIGDYGPGIAIAGSLGWYWSTRAVTEGVRWLDLFLQHPEGDARSLAQANLARGFLGMMQADPAAAIPALDRAVSLARAENESRVLVEALSTMSTALNIAGDHQRAEEVVTEARRIVESTGDRVALPSLLQAEGFGAFVNGDPERAEHAHSEGARLSRKNGDLYTLTYCLINLGFARLMRVDLSESKRLFREALECATPIDDRLALFYILDAFACIAAGTGEHRVAAQLLGAAEKLRIDTGSDVNLLLGPLISQAEELARSALGDSTFERELGSGRGMDRGAATALVLGKPPARAHAVKPNHVEILGRREADVGRLVAEGLSNKEIAGRLFISERTVESHVRNILIKLGFSSRVQIASWFTSSR